MPEISRFLGIVIGMFAREHPPPHFHAVYGEFQITVEIGSGVVDGDFRFAVVPGRIVTPDMSEVSQGVDRRALGVGFVRAKKSGNRQGKRDARGRQDRVRSQFHGEDLQCAHPN